MVRGGVSQYPPLSIIFCPSDAISASDVDCISIGLGLYTIDDAGHFCFMFYEWAVPKDKDTPLWRS